LILVWLSAVIRETSSAGLGLAKKAKIESAVRVA